MSEEVKESPVVEGKMAEMVDYVESISVLELSQLVKALEDRLGVSAAAPVAVAAAAPEGGAEAAEEKTEFDVILKDFGAKKHFRARTLTARQGARRSPRRQRCCPSGCGCCCS